MTEALESAINLHRRGELDRAEAAYRRILEASPGNADALHYLGVLSHQKGDSTHGVELIEKALEQSPNYPDALKNLGNVHKESGRHGRAEQCYRKAIKLDADDADAWNNLCIVLKLQGHYEDAIEAGQRSVSVGPTNAIAWLNLGNTLAKAGQLEKAVSAYQRAINLEPGLAVAHHGLSQVIHQLNRKGRISAAAFEEWMAAYRSWLQKVPESPVGRFMLAAISGDSTCPRAPDRYVCELFDGFAASFDEDLARLEYRVPELIRTKLESIYRAPASDLRVLDAGCGTGLCGPLLKPYARSLDGVDLSCGMLARAQRLGVYDQLVEAELTEFLSEPESAYDLIVSADTLCYFGPLDTVLRAVSNALAPGGVLVFSVEELSDARDKGFLLRHSGRYCHAASYVKECLAEAGMTLQSVDRETLRKEGGEPVSGLIVAADFRNKV